PSGMKETDPHLAQWAQSMREARQDTSSHEVYCLSDATTGEPLMGWGGIVVNSSNNVTGERELELDMRPVLQGFVELRVRLSTKPAGSEKAHAKKAYLYATPTALRE